MMWRLDNGIKDRIWRVKWIPSPTSFLVQSSIQVLNSDTYVYSLIDFSTGDWNRGLVFQIFNVDEANIIYSIPLSRTGLEDQLVWWPTHNGQFSVKPAYHLKRVRIRSFKGETSIRGAVSNTLEGNLED